MKTIKDLPQLERPREKIARYGPGRLTNAELLATILRIGTSRCSVTQLAQRILQAFPYDQLASATVDQLQCIDGLGAAKAAEIAATFELGRRIIGDQPERLIMSPHDTWQACSDIITQKKEHFVVFYLDCRNRSIARETISIGTLNSALVHPREVFEPAIAHHAAQIVLAHNHPSGDTQPSDQDLKTTAALVEASRILGISIADHVIVTKDAFFSFHKEGLLQSQPSPFGSDALDELPTINDRSTMIQSSL